MDQADFTKRNPINGGNIIGNADVAPLYIGNPYRVAAVKPSDKARYECILTPIPSYRIKEGKRVPIRYRIVVEAMDSAAALEAVNVLQAQYFAGIVLQEKIVRLVPEAANPALPENHAYSVKGGKARRGTHNA